MNPIECNSIYSKIPRSAVQEALRLPAGAYNIYHWFIVNEFEPLNRTTEPTRGLN